MAPTFSARLMPEWKARADPLSPSAALAIGDAAARLSRRLLELDASQLTRLRAVASPRLILVLGLSEDLPWVDGIRYFARDGRATALLLPTALAPTVSSVVLQRAIEKLVTPSVFSRGAPWVVCESSHLLIPTANALALRPERLRAWQDSLSASPEPSPSSRRVD